MPGIKIPTVLNLERVYLNDGESSEEIDGLGSKIELPDFEQKTVEVSGSGVMGTIKEAVLGLFENLTVGLTFSAFTKTAFRMMAANRPLTLDARLAFQDLDRGTSIAGFYGSSVLMRGRTTTLKLGSLEPGESTDTKVEVECTYIKVMCDNVEAIVVDKLNSIYVVWGRDVLEEAHMYVD